MQVKRAITVLLASVVVHSSNAEDVFVKYRGLFNLDQMDCLWTQRSSLVRRVCYHAAAQYLIVNLRGTYYHYCHVPPRTAFGLVDADSMGSFYNEQIKGNFDCRSQ